MTTQNLKLTWRHLDPSPSLTALVEDELAALTRMFRDPLSCEVTIERGDRFATPDCRVRVVVETRGTTLVADHEPALDDETDAYAEVREAFQNVRRQLTRHLQRKAPRSGDKIASHLPR